MPRRWFPTGGSGEFVDPDQGGVPDAGDAAAPRKGNGKRAARTLLALEFDRPPEPLDDLPAGRQTEPGTGVVFGGVEAPEELKDALVVLRGDADAVVAHLDADAVLTWLRQRHAHAGEGRLVVGDRVDDELGEQLVEPLLRGEHRRLATRPRGRRCGL